MKTRSIILYFLIIAGFSSSLLNNAVAQESNRSIGHDTAFISRNIQENKIEISLARLALEKAADAEIKKAATQIELHHSQTLAELRRIERKKTPGEMVQTAADNSVTVLTGIQNFESATGKEFERMWLVQMVGRHEAKIEELETALQSLADIELKSLINRSLQKMKVHRDMLARIKYKYQQ